RDFDWMLLLAALTLVTMGTIEIFSSVPSTGGWLKDLWFKQVTSVIIGLIALFITLAIDYRRIYNYIPHIYVIGLLMLIAVLLFGHEVKGQKNWINIGPMTLQPSEFVKICVILALAR